MFFSLRFVIKDTETLLLYYLTERISNLVVFPLY